MSPERTGRLLQWRTWLVAALVAVAAAAVSWGGVAWRLDAWYYDRLLASSQLPPDDSIVVVAVDEHSLEQIGQWPWPRSVHAALIDRLMRAGVRGIAFDILFSEPGRDGGAGDAALAAAIAASGRTVLPVMPERKRGGGPLVESMQVPAIGIAGMHLGHTDVELDRDDVARSVYLRAGLGDAHWPTLGLASLQLDPRTKPDRLPGLRAPRERPASPYLWQRDHHVLLRYAGPPGSFAQVSYADVLQGRIDPRLLRDRWVVVGVTAANLGRMFLTPMSGTVRMSGPEYQANIVAMLLRAAGLWFAPMAAIAVVLAGHLLWTLAHLRHWREQASTDPLTRVANRRSFDQTLATEIASARRTGMPLSLLLIDVDHFKHYNDGNGHHAGDTALTQVGDLILRFVRRPRDLAARFGGDEFALIMPETPASGAERIAQRLVDGARTLKSPRGGGRGITLSIGAYTCVPDASTVAKTLLDGADEALYRAKARGRDRYEVGVPPTSGARA